MRSFLLVVLTLILAAPAAALADTTGPSGPTGPVNPSPPTATTDSAGDVVQNAATARGRVNPGGGETRVTFEYGTTSSYGLTAAAPTLPTGSMTVAVMARLERLTAATTYHYRVVATNAAGVARGADRTFRTASGPSRPGVVTDAAGDVGLDAATMRGRVDPNRQATSSVFEYGTTTRYGARTAPVDVGSGDAGIGVTARVGGLRPNTLYHVRLRATNATGTTTGADRAFRTAGIPLTLSAAASAQTILYTRILTVTGRLEGTGASGVSIALERRNFPFDVGFRAFGTPQRTDAAGAVRFTVPPFTLASQFRLVAPGRSVASNVATVQVRAFVRLRAVPLRRGRVRLSGSVAPDTATGSVAIQRRATDGRYILVRRLSLRPGAGVARFATVLRRRGVMTRYRAATRLRSGALSDGRSSVIRLAGSMRTSTIRPERQYPGSR